MKPPFPTPRRGARRRLGRLPLLGAGAQGCALVALGQAAIQAAPTRAPVASHRAATDADFAVNILPFQSLALVEAEEAQTPATPPVATPPATTPPVATPTPAPAVAPTVAPAATQTPTPTPTPVRDSVPPLPGPQQNPPIGDQQIARPVTTTQNPNAVLPPAPPIVVPPTLPGQPPTTGTVGQSTTGTGNTPPPTTPLGSAPGTVPPAQHPGGVVTGQEPSSTTYSLTSPNGVVYNEAQGVALAENDVTLQYGNFRVHGDRGVYNGNTKTATMLGNLTVEVVVEDQTRVFTGQSLSLNTNTGRWTLTQIARTFEPNEFPPGTVLEPLYVRDGKVTGLDEDVRGSKFKFSSCDRDHYYLKADRLEFYRTPTGEPSRIVLRKNSLYVFDHKVLPLPVYVIPLLSQSSRRQPLEATAGQNDIDGYFVKTLYNFSASEKATNSLLIDGLQKRGLGLGIQRELAAGGLFYLYSVTGQTGGREINAKVSKNYQLAPGYVAGLQFDASNNNSVTGQGISSRTGDFTLSRNGARAQSTAVLSLDQSSFSGASTNSQTLSLEHRQNFGAGYSLQLRSQLNQADSSNGVDTGTQSQAKTIDSEFQLSKTSRQFDLFLRAEMHNDLVQNRNYQLERLPELTFQSSTSRLPLPLLSNFLPGNFTLSYGQFNEPTVSAGSNVGGTKARTDFFYNALPKNYRLLGNGGSTSVLSLSGNFEQAFYSDDTARYNYSYNANLNNVLGPFRMQLNYAKQRTYGFTPFSFDFLTPGEYLDYTFSYQRSTSLRVNLNGGRDLQNSFSRDIVASAQWAPTDSFYASIGTSFVQEGDRFGDIYGNFRLTGSRKRFLGGAASMGFRYTPSGANAGLTRVNGAFDVQLGQRNRFQVLLSYDGITRKFDFSQYRYTRDLHCFNLFVTYDSQRSELRFDLALKVFPFTDTRFGRNQLSEGFDSSVGAIQ